MKRNEKSVYGSISLIKETAGIMDDTAAQTGIYIFNRFSIVVYIGWVIDIEYFTLTLNRI